MGRLSESRRPEVRARHGRLYDDRGIATDLVANDKAASVYQNAKRSARHPGIAARSKELQLELLPDPGDVRAIGRTRWR